MTPARASGVAALVTSGFEEVVVLGIVESDRVDLIQEAMNVVKVMHLAMVNLTWLLRGSGGDDDRRQVLDVLLLLVDGTYAGLLLELLHELLQAVHARLLPLEQH